MVGGTPRFGNPLALLSILSNLPAEWGVVDGEAQFQFHSDMQVQGPANDRMWAAVYGSDEYVRAKASVNPFEYVAYGALAMNIIAQAFPPPLQPAGQPQFQFRAYAANMSQDMSYVVQAHPRPPVWDEDHRFFEPCTVLTYDWQTNQLFAPFLTEANAGASFFMMFGNPLHLYHPVGYQLAMVVLGNPGDNALRFPVPQMLRDQPAVVDIRPDVPPPGPAIPQANRVNEEPAVQANLPRADPPN
ncbi:hypothetical protein TKK_0002578 [Trichogramma kaykai]